MGAPPVIPPSSPVLPESTTLAVEVAYSPRAGEVEMVSLQLPVGSTVIDALRASGLPRKHGLDEATLRAGIWCKPKDLAAPLRDRDRVEMYRPLRVDPKEARRLRYKRHLENAQGRGLRPGPPGSSG